MALHARTLTIARLLREFLKKTDRFAKTIVLCVDQQHAVARRGLMRAISVRGSGHSMRRCWRLLARSCHDTSKLETSHPLSATLPLPPLGEQYRIVSDLDALLTAVLYRAFARAL